MIRSHGCDQKGRRLIGKLELKRWVLSCFLNEVTEGLFLIWKGKSSKEQSICVTQERYFPDSFPIDAAIGRRSFHLKSFAIFFHTSIWFMTQMEKIALPILG